MSKRQVEQVEYHPPRGYDLDLVVMSIGELKKRGSDEHFRLPQRADFHLLIGIAGGRCHHMIDFVPHACAQRSWLTLRPGQIQRFDFSKNWEGWQIVYRPEFLLPLSSVAARGELTMVGRLENLPNHLELSAAEHAAALHAAIQMRRDAGLRASAEDRNALFWRPSGGWRIRASSFTRSRRNSVSTKQPISSSSSGAWRLARRVSSEN